MFYLRHFQLSWQPGFIVEKARIPGENYKFLMWHVPDEHFHISYKAVLFYLYKKIAF